jgi:molecular chaperone GrpE
MSESKSSESETLSGEAAGGDAGAPKGVDELTAALDASRVAAEQAREQALRAQAEAENVRRRAQRDVENAHKFALERFASELLPVVDSLERAVDSARALGGEGPAAAIASGVELSLKLFIDTLSKADLIQLDPAGEPFDPKFHQAVGMVESDRAEPGSVLQVLQKGYTLNGRLVRPAMVIVSKAPANSSA